MSAYFNVSIHSDISEFPTEKRYETGTKIAELKKKLELITGAGHDTMQLTLTIGERDPVNLSDNDKTLLDYAGSSTETLKLTVKDDKAKESLSEAVPKYTISEEKYQERPNNARSFIKEMREKRMSGQS